MVSTHIENIFWSFFRSSLDTYVWSYQPAKSLQNVLLHPKYEVILMFGIVQALLPVKTLTIFTIGAPNFFLILTGSMRVVEQNVRIDFPDFQARGG